MIYAILLIALLMMAISAVRARAIVLRAVPAYRALQQTVSAAVESGRGVHVSLGSSALLDESALTAIAGAELLYQTAARASGGDLPVTASTSDPVTLGIAQDRLRRAYALRNRPEVFKSTLARWYPSGDASLALAAGVGAALLDEEDSLALLCGRFGAELALIAEAAIRYDRDLLPHSTQIEGQAIAYATSATPLLAEELFVSAAYLEPTPLNIGAAAAQDALRYLVVFALIALAVLAFLGVNL
ncbi:MAG: hypothetical protein CUN49_13005 [Candidatus Thermofonsia Clade 1 bacterium]|jgi:hypothetical protein|uniref:DUF6754 domain-containing protein n=1 Tax=Candidatus Thermofonsia Clade 1 bacterium TaxID=2364210 RepID=A0A2M8Q0T8_9CHLR|nr:MAG: hypothetical protein CUN49_13005 [Candidatus Thermofonsia Clade 1 bacterium]PJF43402.1 MAG: hypothetical protein CUN50_00320 [Candidatus Thermofonsia Clade 1 bacterium]